MRPSWQVWTPEGHPPRPGLGLWETLTPEATEQGEFFPLCFWARGYPSLVQSLAFPLVSYVALESHLTFLCFCFRIYKIGMVQERTSWGCGEDQIN